MLKWEAMEQIAREADARGDKEAAKRARAEADKRREKARKVLPNKIEALKRMLEREQKAGATKAIIANLERNIKRKTEILDSLTPHVSPVTKAATEAKKSGDKGDDIDE